MIKSKKSEMGKACGTYGEKEELHTWLCCGDIREGYHLEYLGVDGKIILKWVFKKSVQREWNDVALSWSLARVVMNLQVP